MLYRNSSARLYRLLCGQRLAKVSSVFHLSPYFERLRGRSHLRLHASVRTRAHVRVYARSGLTPRPPPPPPPPPRVFVENEQREGCDESIQQAHSRGSVLPVIKHCGLGFQNNSKKTVLKVII